ncbi:hypothetical protein MM440_16705 [Arsenicicoccus piscis]|uniref:GNAT family N-acetyltransferase n=1 Tax=Arsenicicoccus piscis TaxID=673954 RepID=A0ABQ6HS88_9MICO|nr:hypothetical protein [Arsenicicoccus piscis]MCH8629364.1 hypothetical protein [Arsenicicoccus piscis]GMA20430.1 hypothetical protein GCM10025862_24510 [Arsenicicoccus piscis]
MSARTQADPVHLRITPVAHGDAVALLSVFAGMSARSRYLRYHTGIRTLTSRMVSHLTDLAPGRHVAHAAWLGAEPVGLVRWIRSTAAPDRADLALEVVDGVHGCGIGALLAATSARSASAEGVRWLHCYVDPENVRVRAWLLARGAERDLIDPSALLVPVETVCAAV